MVWREPGVQVQVAAAVIQEGTAFHVWLYLFRERAPCNPLYRQGFDRIGCSMCPSSDMAVVGRIRGLYPALRAGWEGIPEEWRKSHGLPEEWIRRSHWRVRVRNR